MNNDELNNGVNKGVSNNKYVDYLPKNRYKAESSDKIFFVSPKLLKKITYVFYFCFLLTFVGIVLHFTGYDVLKIKDRNYNMNLEEKIYLSNFYQSPNVEWVSSDDSIQIENNVITAVKPEMLMFMEKKMVR